MRISSDEVIYRGKERQCSAGKCFSRADRPPLVRPPVSPYNRLLCNVLPRAVLVPNYS